MALTQETLITLYREEMGSLYGYVSRRTAGNRALSEDIVQETFLRAVRSWRADGLPPVPEAWLRRVAHNLLMSHFRKHRPESLEDHNIDLKTDFRPDLPKLNEAEREFRIARLETEEIEASGTRPDRSLYADLVNGRDYVSEYLEIEKDALMREFELLTAHRDWLAQRHGAAGERYLSHEIETHEFGLRELNDKLELRERFLAGEVDVQAVQIEEELSRAVSRRADLERKLGLLVEEAAAAEDRFLGGVSDDADWRYFQFQLAETEAQLRLAQREAEILQRARRIR